MTLRPRILSLAGFAGRMLTLGLLVLCVARPAMAQQGQMTPEQLEALMSRLEAIRATIEEKSSTLNSSAADAFRTGAADPKAAVELYKKCVHEVNYTREGRNDSDYRAWESNNSDQLRDAKFAQALQVQLKYLYLALMAAEANELKDVLPQLTTYVDSLSHLTESPDQILQQSVNGSIFAEAYNLDKKLQRNQAWEPVPYNISGIYDKAILPYLRAKMPDQLMAAWDRRIDQQTRMVEFLEAKQEEDLRGVDRDERRRMLDRRPGNGGGEGGGGGGNANVLREHDRDNFYRETLPSLQWRKLVDKFTHVDRVGGAAEMLAFLSDNISNPKAEDWLAEATRVFQGVGKGSPASTTSVTTTEVVPFNPPITRSEGKTVPDKKLDEEEEEEAKDRARDSSSSTPVSPNPGLGFD